MYAGVPTMAPVSVSFASSAAATPKSTSFATNGASGGLSRPLPTRKMFDGLTSRWMTPARCAEASASDIIAPMSRHCVRVSGARFSRCATSSPSSHSMAT